MTVTVSILVQCLYLVSMSFYIALKISYIFFQTFWKWYEYNNLVQQNWIKDVLIFIRPCMRNFRTVKYARGAANLGVIFWLFSPEGSKEGVLLYVNSHSWSLFHHDLEKQVTNPKKEAASLWTGLCTLICFKYITNQLEYMSLFTNSTVKNPPSV